LYLVFDNDISIFTYITDITGIIAVEDTLPAASLLRPNITAGGTAAFINIEDVIAGIDYAPLGEYGEEIGLPKSGQESLILTKGAYQPITADPSNYPFLTIDFVVCKFQKPETLQ